MKIEEIIIKNKESFEENLPTNLWSKIDEKLPKEKKKLDFFKNYQLIKIAAGIFICLSIGYFFGKKSLNDSKYKAYESIDPLFSKSLVNYQELVEDKKEDLESLIVKSPDLLQSFNSDFDTLKEDFNSLKAQLPNNPNQKQLLEAMIQNLQLQIELLNKQLEIAEKLKEKSYI